MKNNLFTERLNEIRRRKKITQVDMAKILYVTPQAMSNYFRGREVTFDLLVMICEEFDVSADYMLGLTDIPKNYTDQQLAEENQYLRNQLKNIQSIIIETRGI